MEYTIYKKETTFYNTTNDPAENMRINNKRIVKLGQKFLFCYLCKCGGIIQDNISVYNLMVYKVVLYGKQYIQAVKCG